MPKGLFIVTLNRSESFLKKDGAMGPPHSRCFPFCGRVSMTGWDDNEKALAVPEGQYHFEVV